MKEPVCLVTVTLAPTADVGSSYSRTTISSEFVVVIPEQVMEEEVPEPATVVVPDTMQVGCLSVLESKSRRPAELYTSNPYVIMFSSF